MPRPRGQAQPTDTPETAPSDFTRAAQAPTALNAAATAAAAAARQAVRTLHGRPAWEKAVLGAAASVLVVHLGVCSYIYGRQRKMLYRPQPRHLPATHDDLRLTINGNLLQITHRAPTQAPPNAEQPGAPQMPALIYFGGNAEDVSLQLKRFVRIWPHRALYLVHYRGWGSSGGKPKEIDLMADALAVFDHVKATHDDVAVIGRSLGTGVAVRVASERPVSALVLVTPYDSITKVARDQMPFWLPVNWLLKDRWESVLAAPAVTAPTTVIQAGRDTVIGAARTEALQAAFKPGIAQLHLLPEADHTSVLFTPQYRALLAQAIA